MNIIIQETIINPILQVNDATNEVVISIQESVNNIDVLVSDVAIPGQQGDSLYSIAVDNGFQGTASQYLEVQKNIDGGLIF